MLKTAFGRLGVIGVLLMVGLGVSVSASHSWSNFHWARQQNPVSLKVGNNLTTTDWETSLTTAVNDWNGSAVLSLTVVPGASPKKNCRPTAGRIEVCNATYGNNGWLGIAQVWVSGGHITQATSKVNDTYYNTAVYNTPAWRQYVMCQEIGHDFGLDHQDETFTNGNLDTCMDYTNNPQTNQHPNLHDYEQLEAIYAHLDSYTSAGASKLPRAMPPAMGLIDFDSPGQWGRLVSRSRNGRHETYELDFGRGNKVITHVFWADPVADAH